MHSTVTTVTTYVGGEPQERWALVRSRIVETGIQRRHRAISLTPKGKAYLARMKEGAVCE